MGDSTKPTISTAQAIAMIRQGNIDTMPRAQRIALRDVLEQNPAILVLNGCDDALRRLEATDPRATSEESADGATRSPLPKRSPAGWIPVALVLTVIAAVGAYLYLGRNEPLTITSTKSSSPTPPAPSATNEPEPSELGRVSPIAEEETTPPPAPGLPDEPAEPLPLPDPGQAPPNPVALENPPSAQDPPPEIELVGGKNVRLVPGKRGGYRLTGMNGQTKVKLRGKTSRLSIDAVVGQASVDLSELEVHHTEFSQNISGNSRITLQETGGVVVFLGPIAGGTKIDVDAPGGRVEFRGPVAGRAKITIKASEGRVHFHQIARKGAVVGGGAQVQITARTVNFAAGLHNRAEATVILDKNGTLHHGLLNGSSKLTYRKANPADPDPKVEGNTSGRGKLIALGVGRSN